jgi:hypothetical protein
MGPAPVTRPLPGDRDGSQTSETLAALEMLGFTKRDRLRLRFTFEASDHRRAVELAGELRMTTWNAVQVRPGPMPLRGASRWTVVLRTRPMLLTPAVVGSRVSEMEEMARRHPGCRYVGWTPVLDAVEVNRLLLRPADP